MKIGIDISQIAYEGTGVAVYTENLINSLLRVDKENEYIFFYSSFRQPFRKLKLNTETTKAELKEFKLPPLLLELLWNRFHCLEVEKLIGIIDVFHTSDWLEPPTRCPKVTTIHDLAILKYPQTFRPKGGHDIVENLKRKFAWVKKESEIVVAVSKNTRNDIIELLGIPENKVKVIYEAADPFFKPIKSKETSETIKNKYNIVGKYIIAVGTREPRKNLKKAIEAYGILGKKDISFVLVGKYGWGEDLEKLGLNTKNIKLLDYVTKEDLRVLYSGAETLIYPSLYEGFGLPVLEAMACGCPIVTSNSSSLPEIVGKAGILIDPNSVEDIAAGLEKAFSEKNNLIKASLEQAKNFSWEKTAKETIGIYREVAKN